MDDSQLPTPHNNFFNYAFSHISAARSLIETHLPLSVIQSLDLNTLELMKDSFVDGYLRDSYSDLLYCVQLAGAERDTEATTSDALVYMLFEHKSASDTCTCFQLLRYIVRIWEHRQRNGLRLCPVIPMVLYHGTRVWSAPRSLEELIDAPPSVAQYSVRFTFPLLDLTQVPDESLARDPFLKSVLHLLKYSRRDEFSDWFEQILRWLLEPSATSFRKEHVDVFLVYVMATSQSIPAEVLSMTLQKVFPTQIEPGSIADQLLKRGRQEGHLEGRQEGRMEGLMEGRQEGHLEGLMEGRQEGRLEGFLEGRQEGRQEAMQEFEISCIQILQECLGVPVESTSSLQSCSLDELRLKTADLRSQIQRRLKP